jgi:hypothetical protein
VGSCVKGSTALKWEDKTVKLRARGSTSREIDASELDAILDPLGHDGWELVTSVAIHESMGYTREIVLTLKREVSK